ncbi:hypothetical protein HC928_23470 [bacterium]|nr:hypothetical protein [bacterium]
MGRPPKRAVVQYRQLPDGTLVSSADYQANMKDIHAQRQAEFQAENARIFEQQKHESRSNAASQREADKRAAGDKRAKDALRKREARAAQRATPVTVVAAASERPHQVLEAFAKRIGKTPDEARVLINGYMRKYMSYIGEMDDEDVLMDINFLVGAAQQAAMSARLKNASRSELNKTAIATFREKLLAAKSFEQMMKLVVPLG